MNGTILKSLLLTFVILFNVYAFNTHIPTVPLLKMHLTLAVAILVLMFIVKNNMVTLLSLWFLLVLFQKVTWGSVLPMLPRISPDRIIFILIVLFFLFEFMFKGRKIQAFSSIEMTMIAFSMYILFSMIASGTMIKATGLSFGVYLVAYGFPFFMFFISKNVIDDENKIKKFFIFLCVIGLYLGLTGIFEYFRLDQLVFPRKIVQTMGGGLQARSRGPFLQPAVNGTVIGMIILSTLILLRSECSKWRKNFYIISLISMIVTLLFTFTRSCWLAFIVAIFTIPIFAPRLRGVFIQSLLGLIILILFLSTFVNINARSFGKEDQFYFENATLIEKLVTRFTAESSVTGRVDLLKMGYMVFMDQPFFGHGFGTFGKLVEKYGISLEASTLDRDISKIHGIHDTTVALLVDVGLIGVSMYLFILFNILNVYRKLYKKLPREGFLGRELMVICIGTFIVFLINAQFFDMRLYIFPNTLFFCIAGIMVGFYHRLSGNENKSSGRLTV